MSCDHLLFFTSQSYLFSYKITGSPASIYKVVGWRFANFVTGIGIGVGVRVGVRIGGRRLEVCESPESAVVRAEAAVAGAGLVPRCVLQDHGAGIYPIIISTRCPSVVPLGPHPTFTPSPCPTTSFQRELSTPASSQEDHLQQCVAKSSKVATVSASERNYTSSVFPIGQLSQVNLCENELESLPTGLLHLSQIQQLSAAKNKLCVLFNIPNGTNWIGLRRLQELDVSDNCLTDLSSAVLHCFKSLNSLNISRNRLGRFPDPWACPLKICRAANNEIESLPDTISIFWRTHLKEVDFSENILKELPSYIFELEAIISLKLCGNRITTLPAPSKWKCSQLRTLDLSRNQLGK
ncbi:hypothetical protein NFI96_008641 [Prochilodus magdalenae]|nr:hypothetical protein NFI96_008641 [Prochilodus magdalenae]